MFLLLSTGEGGTQSLGVGLGVRDANRSRRGREKRGNSRRSAFHSIYICTMVALLSPPGLTSFLSQLVRTYHMPVPSNRTPSLLLKDIQVPGRMRKNNNLKKKKKNKLCDTESKAFLRTSRRNSFPECPQIIRVVATCKGAMENAGALLPSDA